MRVGGPDGLIQADLQRKIQNVDRGVDITIQFQQPVRVGTQMSTNPQSLLDNPAAGTAPLRGVGGVYRRYVTASFYRFAVEQLSEQAQRRIVCRQGQVRIAEHEIE